MDVYSTLDILGTATNNEAMSQYLHTLMARSASKPTMLAREAGICRTSVYNVLNNPLACKFGTVCEIVSIMLMRISALESDKIAERELQEASKANEVNE